MIDVERIYYLKSSNYHEGLHCKQGWSFLISKVQEGQTKRELSGHLIHREKLSEHLKTNNYNQHILIDLTLNSNQSLRSLPAIELEMNHEIVVLCFLLFTYFENKESNYCIDTAINMIQRKFFKKNATILNEYLDVFNLINHIQENLCMGITVDYLADFMFMSKATLKRFCSQKIGKSPINLLWDVRKAEAKNFLENTDELVSDIAKKIGFLNSRAFTVFFKRETGLTPTAYRSYYKELLYHELNGGESDETASLERK